MLDVDINGFPVFIFFEDHELGVFDDLLGPFPFEVFELRRPLRGDGLILVELSVGGGEFRISPFVARVVCEPFENGILVFVVFSHGIVVLVRVVVGIAFLNGLGGVLNLEFRVGTGDFVVIVVVIDHVLFVVVVGIVVAVIVGLHVFRALSVL